MQRLNILFLFPLLGMVGCGLQPNTPQPPREQVAVGKPVTMSEPKSRSISQEAFNQIPKNMMPEDLERRSDTSVVIRAGDNETIKEYRINGFLYSIEVIPKIGPPYYLVAADTQGNFMRMDKPGMLIPSWRIFQWK